MNQDRLTYFVTTVLKELLKYAGVVVLLVVLFNQSLSASASSKGKTINRLSAAELLEHKIPVELNIGGLGKKEIEIIFKDSIAYLPIIETFTYLSIKTTFDSVNLQVRGFYKSADNEYVIDLNNGRSRIGKHELTITEEDFLLTAAEVYVRLEFLNDMFGLDFSYNPRGLRVDLRKAKDLPAYLAAERHRRARPFGRQVEIPEPAVYYGREVSFIGAGRLDWTASLQYNPKQSQFTSRHSLTLGIQMLGGDVTARYVGNSTPKRYTNTLHGQIRYPIFNTSTVRQVIVGDYFTSGIFPRQVKGMEVTNRPFAQRVLFSREVYRGQFEPNADVELNMTTTGRNFIQADENGAYQFDYPVLYGQGLMEITAYDSWGQARTLRYRMNVPRAVVPQGEVEYSVSSGKLDEGKKTFSKSTTASSNYVLWGVSPDMTLGAKLEYFNIPGGHTFIATDRSDTSYQTVGAKTDTLIGTHLDTVYAPTQKLYGGITATTMLYRGLIFDALIAPSAISRASFDWIFPSNARLTLSGSQYSRNTFFNVANILNSYEFQASLPVDMNNTARLSPELFFGQTNYKFYRNRELQLGVSAAYSIFFPRVSFDYIWRRDNTTSGWGNLFAHLTDVSLGAIMPGGATLLSEIVFNHLSKRIETFQAVLSKRFSNSLLLSGSYVRNSDYYNTGIRVQYFFPFTRAQSTVSKSGIVNGTNQYQYALSGGGSVGYDPKVAAFYFENQPSYVGYGGIVVHPFLDLNGNGKFDKGEARIDPVRAYIANATRGAFINAPLRQLSARNLSLARVPTYEEYDVFLDAQSMDNPIWVPEFSAIRLLSEPNYVRRIDFPVVSGGTIRGTIKIKDGTLKPAEGIKVILTLIQNGTKRKYVRMTSSFSTGEFEINQVPPGAFRIELDPVQVQTLGYMAEPLARQLEIISKTDGDVVSDVDFVLKIK